jgi:hypothetical protein
MITVDLQHITRTTKKYRDVGIPSNRNKMSHEEKRKRIHPNSSSLLSPSYA